MKGVWGLIRSMPTRRWASEISAGISKAMDQEVEKLVIGELLVIVVPVGVLWFAWLTMLDK
jgi:hypothetical protein